MNQQATIAAALISAVPQWYSATNGPHRQDISIGSTKVTFYSHRPPTPELKKLKTYVETVGEDWASKLELPLLPASQELLQDRVALEWLRIQDADIAWPRLLKYLEEARRRTYENVPVATNLVISSGEGSIPLDRGSNHKTLDPLANSPHVFLRIDQELRLLSFAEIPWAQVKETLEYKFHPEFLQPVASVLARGEYSAHLTQRGDIIFMSSAGMLAAKRKGRWNLYDAPTLKNSLTDIVADYRIGCNLFDLLFDLSYRRHGALLIYDPDELTLPHVSNPQSVLSEGKGGQPDPVRKALVDSIGGIEMNAPKQERRKKRILTQLASVDGAVIFDGQRLFAFGAMIRHHPEVESYPGARTTAAESAYLYGSYPFMVSSDGDITAIFHSDRKQTRAAGRGRLRFL
ncbi:hypothetical protein WMF30_30930 [Sorangium sp. So ce134]